MLPSSLPWILRLCQSCDFEWLGYSKIIRQLLIAITTTQASQVEGFAYRVADRIADHIANRNGISSQCTSRLTQSISLPVFLNE